MIRNSFIFLERIGLQKERSIWNQGILSWDDFLNSRKIDGISNWRKSYYERKIDEARKELYSLNSSYFIDKLPNSEMWRLYKFFRDDAVFLDIETSGLSKFDTLTVIGLFDGISTKSMIRGINLNLEAIKKELEKYKLIVTFNGASFDIPFLKKRYPDLLPNIPHFDLRCACKRAGLSGGLKMIEAELGIKRNEIISDFTGGDAATLWRMYKATGDDHYLKLLVEYNEDDVINLKRIADLVVRRMVDMQFQKPELKPDYA